MTAITDRRVRRTRAALLDALISLMTEKGYDAITVQDLIDRADIGRSTFYAHFTDKSDLLHEAMSGLRAIVEPGPDSAPPDRRRPLPFSLRMFQHVQGQHQLLRALLGRPGASPVVKEIEQILLDVARAELDTLAGARSTARVPIDLLAQTVVASFLATLTWWVGNDFRQSPEELNALFQTMVAPGIRVALPPSKPE